MRIRVVLCFLVGGLAGAAFYKLRGFFPAHALLLGIAISALTYSLFRAVDNLRGSLGYGPPRHEEERRDQEDVDETAERPAGE